MFCCINDFFYWVCVGFGVKCLRFSYIVVVLMFDVVVWGVKVFAGGGVPVWGMLGVMGDTCVCCYVW